MASTILVKKKDGSKVRMTMDEFKEYKKQLSTSEPEHQSTPAMEEKSDVEEIKKVETKDSVQVSKSASQQVDIPAEGEKEDIIQDNETKEKEINKTEVQSPKSKVQKTDLPMKNEHHELSTTTPVKNIFVDEAVAILAPKHQSTKAPEKRSLKWTKEDHQSPLEDRMEELKEHDSFQVLPDKKDDLFTEVLKKIKFPVPDDLQSRLHSLITSRIKEIRTDEQFLSYVGRSIDAGGIGLGDVESQELLQTVKDVWHIVDQRRSKQIETKEKPEEIKKPEVVKKQSTKLNVSLPRNSTERKPMLHDIVKPKVQTSEDGPQSPEKHSIGPVEEKKNFSLLDLRRIGNKPDDNLKKLLEKFKVLKKESIILYFEALQAWYQSPLYNQYQDLIFQAVDSGSKLKDLSVGGDSMTWEEVQGIVKMGRKLE